MIDVAVLILCRKGKVVNFQFGAQLVTVNIAKASDLWQEIRSRFKDGHGFALATLNLDHLVKLSSSSSFRKAYIDQDLVVADGNPIVWLSRLAGKPVELMPGSELILPMAKIAAEEGVKVAFVGSTEDSLQKAADALGEMVPNLIVSDLVAPAFGFDPNGDEAASIYDRLNKGGVGLCFIALGAPKQELFAARGRELAPKVGFASIGAGLDFLAGAQKRAPKWVRAIAMEWAWRMLLSPTRLFVRYMRCFGVLPKHTINAIRQRER